ncbi:MAG: hypothetical protein H6Q72_936 [Firmicutes bacterium]|nr:hypothetical protein [Bacillota bacterium]
MGVIATTAAAGDGGVMGRQARFVYIRCDKCHELCRFSEKHNCKGEINMENKRDGIKEINKICKAVLNLTDADFEEVRKMAEGQSNYINPLKPATSHNQQQLGDHNTRVLNALQALREIIKSGAEI